MNSAFRFTKILFVCVSVQASRIMKTWVTEARVILMKTNDTSLALVINLLCVSVSLKSNSKTKMMSIE